MSDDSYDPEQVKRQITIIGAAVTAAVDKQRAAYVSFAHAAAGIRVDWRGAARRAAERELS